MKNFSVTITTLSFVDNENPSAKWHTLSIGDKITIHDENGEIPDNQVMTVEYLGKSGGEIFINTDDADDVIPEIILTINGEKIQ